MARPGTRRPGRGADGLALRRALPDRLLPGLVAAMTFLAALALAGALGASLLARRWSAGAAAVLTVQVPPVNAPSGDTGRMDAVMAVLATEPALASVHRLDQAALARLLSPWLGSTDGIALPLPGVVQLRLRPGLVAPADLQARLDRAASGTVLERNGDWSDRLVVLTTSLQACAGLVVLVVAGVAVTVVAAATRAGLAARRQAIEIVHGLGATDGYIARRFAGRTTRLAVLGGLGGTLLSVPLLLLLCHLAAPFADPAGPVATLPADPTSGVPLLDLLHGVPTLLWAMLPLLPMVAAAIGWTTAQATVRNWLRRLP